MSDPFTDEQVSAAVKAWEPLYDHGEARDRLMDLRCAGITVNFPEPRFYVVKGDGWWVVRDRTISDRWFGIHMAIALFDPDRHPDARCAAQAEADRLNRGADL